MKKLTLTIVASIWLAVSAFAGAQDDLFTASAGCDLDGVKKALEGGADINALNASNQNALASAFFCPDVVRYLIDNAQPHKRLPNSNMIA